MGPALTAEELAALYPHLTPEQRIEMERWHRDRNHARMVGEPVDEQAKPPYPETPPRESRFSSPPCLGEGTGNNIAEGLDPADPQFIEKLAERAGFTYTHQSEDQPPD